MLFPFSRLREKAPKADEGKSASVVAGFPQPGPLAHAGEGRLAEFEFVNAGCSIFKSDISSAGAMAAPVRHRARVGLAWRTRGRFRVFMHRSCVAALCIQC